MGQDQGLVPNGSAPRASSPDEDGSGNRVPNNGQSQSPIQQAQDVNQPENADLASGQEIEAPTEWNAPAVFPDHSLPYAPTAQSNGATAQFKGATGQSNGPTAQFKGATAQFKGATAQFKGSTAQSNGTAPPLNNDQAKFAQIVQALHHDTIIAQLVRNAPPPMGGLIHQNNATSCVAEVGQRSMRSMSVSDVERLNQNHRRNVHAQRRLNSNQNQNTIRNPDPKSDSTNRNQQHRSRSVSTSMTDYSRNRSSRNAIGSGRNRSNPNRSNYIGRRIPDPHRPACLWLRENNPNMTHVIPIGGYHGAFSNSSEISISAIYDEHLKRNGYPRENGRTEHEQRYKQNENALNSFPDRRGRNGNSDNRDNRNHAPHVPNGSGGESGYIGGYNGSYAANGIPSQNGRGNHHSSSNNSRVSGNGGGVQRHVSTSNGAVESDRRLSTSGAGGRSRRDAVQETFPTNQRGDYGGGSSGNRASMEDRFNGMAIGGHDPHNSRASAFPSQNLFRQELFRSQSEPIKRRQNDGHSSQKEISTHERKAKSHRQEHRRHAYSESDSDRTSSRNDRHAAHQSPSQLYDETQRREHYTERSTNHGRCSNIDILSQIAASANSWQYNQHREQMIPGLIRDDRVRDGYNLTDSSDGGVMFSSHRASRGDRHSPKYESRSSSTSPSGNQHRGGIRRVPESESEEGPVASYIPKTRRSTRSTTNTSSPKLSRRDERDQASTNVRQRESSKATADLSLKSKSKSRSRKVRRSSDSSPERVEASCDTLESSMFHEEIAEEMKVARAMDMPMNFEKNRMPASYAQLNPHAPDYTSTCHDAHGFPYSATTTNGMTYFHPQPTQPPSSANGYDYNSQQVNAVTQNGVLASQVPATGVQYQMSPIAPYSMPSADQTTVPPLLSQNGVTQGTTMPFIQTPAQSYPQQTIHPYTHTPAQSYPQQTIHPYTHTPTHSYPMTPFPSPHLPFVDGSGQQSMAVAHQASPSSAVSNNVDPNTPINYQISSPAQGYGSSPHPEFINQQSFQLQPYNSGACPTPTTNVQTPTNGNLNFDSTACNQGVEMSIVLDANGRPVLKPTPIVSAHTHPSPYPLSHHYSANHQNFIYNSNITDSQSPLLNPAPSLADAQIPQYHQPAFTTMQQPTSVQISSKDDETPQNTCPPPEMSSSSSFPQQPQNSTPADGQSETEAPVMNLQTYFALESIRNTPVLKPASDLNDKMDTAIKEVVANLISKADNKDGNLAYIAMVFEKMLNYAKPKLTEKLLPIQLSHCLRDLVQRNPSENKTISVIMENIQKSDECGNGPIFRSTYHSEDIIEDYDGAINENAKEVDTKWQPEVSRPASPITFQYMPELELDLDAPFVTVAEVAPGSPDMTSTTDVTTTTLDDDEDEDDYHDNANANQGPERRNSLRNVSVGNLCTIFEQNQSVSPSHSLQ